MSFFQSTILGLIQGITEFLPVSSSGHLILIREWLSVNPENALLFDVVLHFATALAVLVYFRKDITQLVYILFKKDTWHRSKEGGQNTTKILFWSLLLGTLPAVIVGFFFESIIASTFRSSFIVACALIIGALLFILAEHFYKGDRELTLRKGIGIGLFQVLAFIPGFSRSGATISGGLLLGMSREESTRFAFLLSLPVLLGAGLVKTIELFSIGISGGALLSILFGAFIAFAVGLGAIHFMIRFVRTHTLWPFVIYRLVLAGIILMYSL